MSTEHMLEKEPPNELSRTLDFVEWYRGDVGNVHGEEEYRHDSDGDEPSISDSACRALRAFYFSDHVECVSPSSVCKIRLDKSCRECIGIGRAPLPDVMKVSKRIRDASEPRQNRNTRDSDTMEHR